MRTATAYASAAHAADSSVSVAITNFICCFQFEFLFGQSMCFDLVQCALFCAVVLVAAAVGSLFWKSAI